ncbi:hypothetical protein [Micromonospora peucetia]|uniref:WD40-like Beta Propeller Repeat n=1 Tax=Micromonospora peucetia TaxID=47871 RepID=A0A1C6U383_9ACTN|nr:hypothetical protein [Micromonospora peucetia]WSA33342.1 hypothetical protein OIE14_04570 [Micromonospora peucetia]SCL48368.1 hypothetical protein GA0070608_0365 [Micromonospora peucetia]
MRRAVSSVTVVLGLLGATVACTGVALAAAPASASSPLAAAPGKKRCTVTDERLRELSGLVATKSGYIVINDGTDVESRKRVFFLDAKCGIAKEPVRYSGQGPFDTEDLALSPDGTTLWIADTGDNVTSRERRERVALWSMPVNGSKRPVLHRLGYPEGKPHDAEALLIGDDGNPLIITKVMSGKAQIFSPTGPLKSGDTPAVPMKQVGEIALPATDTDNRLGAPGRVAITGAARSPDGSRVVLRTYADAFEYDVTGGNVVAALTSGKPRVTALADPFGEAITYSPDGKTFLTVSDGGQLDEDTPIDILGYTPSTEGAKPVAGGADAPKKEGQSWIDGLSLSDITYLIAAVGVVGALMVAAGVFGILRARRKPAPTRDDDPDRDGVVADDRRGSADDGFLPPGDRGRGGVYGGAPAGGVYGGPAGGGRGGVAPTGGGGHGGVRPAGGGVYGGARPAAGSGGAGVYGGARPPVGGPPGFGGPPPGGGGGGRQGAGGRQGGGVGGRHGGGGGGRQGGGVGGRHDGGGGGRHGGGYPGGAYGGEGQSDGGGYGGGRAEPPRRGGEPDPRGQRPVRRRDDGPEGGRGYGPEGGRGYGPEGGRRYGPEDGRGHGHVPDGGRGYRGDRY